MCVTQKAKYESQIAQLKQNCQDEKEEVQITTFNIYRAIANKIAPSHSHLAGMGQVAGVDLTLRGHLMTLLSNMSFKEQKATKLTLHNQPIEI